MEKNRSLIPAIKGLSILTPAMILEKVGYFVVTLTLSRTIPVDDFGRYTFAIYAGVTIAVLTDFGMRVIVNREIVKTPENASQILGAATLTRLPLMLLSIFALTLLDYFSVFDPDQSFLLWTLGTGQLLLAAGYIANAVFRSFKLLHLEALTVVLRGLLYGSFALVPALIGAPLRIIALSALAGNAISLIITTIILWNACAPAFSQKTWRNSASLLVSASSLSVNYLTSAAYHVLFIYIARIWLSNLEVGYFNSAYSITSQFHFLPEMIMAASFPFLVRSLEQPGKVHRPLAEILLIALSVSLPISIGLNVVADPLVSIIFGEPFQAASSLTAWMVWILPAYFWNNAFLFYWNARLKDSIWLAINILGILANLLCVWWLTPIMGGYGMITARIGSEVLISLVALIFSSANIDWRRLLTGILQLSGAGAALYLIAAPLNRISIVASIAGGVFVYVTCFIAFGPWSKILQAQITKRFLLMVDKKQ